jgi:hypothetical protein
VITPSPTGRAFEYTLRPEFTKPFSSSMSSSTVTRHFPTFGRALLILASVSAFFYARRWVIARWALAMWLVLGGLSGLRE